MKKRLLITCSLMAMLSLILIGEAAYSKEESQGLTTIIKRTADITGDKKKDILMIEANENKKVFKEITLHIRTSEGDSYKKSFGNGRKPFLSTADLDNDGKEEILLSLPSRNKGVPPSHRIFSIIDRKMTDVDLPGPITVSSQLKQDYKASLTVEDTKETFEFDLKNRKKKYEKLGLYDNGLLNEPMELIVQPYNKLHPAKYNGTYLIVGEQMFSGAANGDKIGKITSTWSIENGEWKLQEVNVKKIKEKRQKLGKSNS